MQNRLLEASKFGQSLWYDNISRASILQGDLHRLVTEDGIGGVTSNPAIFQKAISDSDDYDPAIAALVASGVREAKPLFEALAIQDIQLGADLLYPHYRTCQRADGYVSLEVSPHLANDTQRTLREARRLHAAVGRENVMIKVPATPAGLPAIEQLTAEGINVNVTLLFAIETYESVARAYMNGLETLSASGGDPTRVASVASFFVSRIDAAIDAELADRMEAAGNPEQAASLGGLRHRVAIANAKLAYERYEALVASDRWQALARRGARPQRLLWASTGTKDPSLPATLYVDALMGRDTVNTLPGATLDAFRKSGRASDALGENAQEDRERARKLMLSLGEQGIDLGKTTEDLLDAGCKLFCDAFDGLLETLEDKRQRLAAG